ncbi:MAG: FHA domain-containing protein [Erythrobacter sp.]|nr:FHA domain-containing protein [Erythrobacter sp.]
MIQVLDPSKEKTESWKTSPHFQNLNEDPMLSGQIKHSFINGKNRIGRQNEKDPPNVVLGGLGIVKDHCTVEYDDDTKMTTILPNEDDNEKNKVYLNGKLLTEATFLKNCDRLLFGNHNYFVFVNPEEKYDDEVDW